MANTNFGISLPAANLAKEITMTVNITGYHGWIVRLKVATFLVWLACKIAGTNFKTETKESEL